MPENSMQLAYNKITEFAESLLKMVQALFEDPEDNPQNPRKFRILNFILKPFLYSFFIINLVAYAVIAIDFTISPIIRTYLSSNEFVDELSETPPIRITLNFQGPNSTDMGFETFSLQLNSITLPGLGEVKEPYCIDKLFITGALESGWLAQLPDLNEAGPVYEFDGVCLRSERYIIRHSPSQETNEFVASEDRIEIFDFTSSIVGQRFYPFDSRRGKIAMWLETDTDANVTIYPVIRADNGNWRTSTSLENQNIIINGEEENITLLKATFKRPLSIRIVTPLLLIAVFGFTIIILFIPDTGSALEVSVAIILGLWGIREILVTETSDTISLIESSILITYLILANVAFFRFIGLPIKKRIDQHTKSWKKIISQQQQAEIVDAKQNSSSNSKTSTNQKTEDSKKTRAFWLSGLFVGSLITLFISQILRRRKRSEI